MERKNYHDGARAVREATDKHISQFYATLNSTCKPKVKGIFSLFIYYFHFLKKKFCEIFFLTILLIVSSSQPCLIPKRQKTDENISSPPPNIPSIIPQPVIQMPDVPPRPVSPETPVRQPIIPQKLPKFRKKTAITQKIPKKDEKNHCLIIGDSYVRRLDDYAQFKGQNIKYTYKRGISGAGCIDYFAKLKKSNISLPPAEKIAKIVIILGKFSKIQFFL